jgi:molecular chaperone DnaK
VGDFRVERLTPCTEPNEVMCRMGLDLDGILHVTAIEKRTGKSKHVTIANALQAKSDEEIAAARKRIEDLYAARADSFEDLDEEEAVEEEEVSPAAGDVIEMAPAWTELRHEAVDLIQRSRRLLDKMHAEDREEAAALEEAIDAAVAGHNQKALAEAVRSLKELLFFVEGD